LAVNTSIMIFSSDLDHHCNWLFCSDIQVTRENPFEFGQIGVYRLRPRLFKQRTDWHCAAWIGHSDLADRHWPNTPTASTAVVQRYAAVVLRDVTLDCSSTKQLLWILQLLHHRTALFTLYRLTFQQPTALVVLPAGHRRLHVSMAFLLIWDLVDHIKTGFTFKNLRQKSIDPWIALPWIWLLVILVFSPFQNPN